MSLTRPQLRTAAVDTVEHVADGLTESTVPLSMDRTPATLLDRRFTAEFVSTQNTRGLRDRRNRALEMRDRFRVRMIHRVNPSDFRGTQDQRDSDEEAAIRALSQGLRDPLQVIVFDYDETPFRDLHPASAEYLLTDVMFGFRYDFTLEET